MMGVNVGPPGSYKTTWLTALARQAYEDGYDVMPNYKLIFERVRGAGRVWAHTDFDIDILGDPDRAVNLFLAVSEIHKWFDARRSGSAENVTRTHNVLEARKGGCHIWGDTQVFINVDVRFRRNLNMLFLMRRPDPLRDLGHAWPYEPRQMVRLSPKPIEFDPTPLFPMFDTNERIRPPEPKKDIPPLPTGGLT